MNAPVRIPGDPAPIGDNVPPVAPTPFDLSRGEIEGLYGEAVHWLDGSGVQTQADADGVSRLLDMLRKATKTADERRVAENKPFDEGKAEVQARYGTLIADTKAAKGKAVLAMECCKKALAPYLAKIEDEKRAVAAAARAEAEAKAREAALAFQVSRATDLEAREQAEALARDAAEAERLARRAENDRAGAKGGARAVTLRTRCRPEITDPRAFARWAWEHHYAELTSHLQTIADRHCANGQRAMPGVTIHEERVAQ